MQVWRCFEFVDWSGTRYLPRFRAVHVCHQPSEAPPGDQRHKFFNRVDIGPVRSNSVGYTGIIIAPAFVFSYIDPHSSDFNSHRRNTATHRTAMSPSRTQLAALWPNPGPSLTVDTPARWPGSTPTSTAAVRGYLQQDFERHHGYAQFFNIHIRWTI